MSQSHLDNSSKDIAAPFIFGSSKELILHTEFTKKKSATFTRTRPGLIFWPPNQNHRLRQRELRKEGPSLVSRLGGVAGAEHT